MTHLLMNVINNFGYLGIFIAMILESACIPIPSEVIMPFGGYLVVSGHLNFWGIVIVGTLGNICGSLAAYYVGYFGGRPAIIKYGRVIHISEHHLQRTELWFARRGELAVFMGRILPIIRTFISLPAGISRMPVWRFVLYTAIGSLPWAYLLTLAGVKLGGEWEHTGRFMHPFTYLVAAGIVIALAAYILKKRKGQPFRAE